MATLNIINNAGTSGVVPDANIPSAIARDSEIGNGTLTVNGGNAITGSGTFTANQSGGTTITLNHQDTSSQGSVSNSGSDFIQGITLDAYGHVTGITSASAGSSGAPSITGVGSHIMMHTVRRNTSYSNGNTVAPTGDGNERYGAVFGTSGGSGSGDFQARTSIQSGNTISGGTWRSNSAGVTNQNAIRVMVRIS